MSASGPSSRSPIQLGLALTRPSLDGVELVQRAKFAESLGFHSIWTSEAYGSDAVSPLAWMASHTQRIRLGTSIMQIPGRSPAMTAMTAMTLDALSGGRMMLGLGLSGPQVAEGWHGQPSHNPLRRTHDYVSIVRQVLAGTTVRQDGDHYALPYTGTGATNARPLRTVLPPRPDLPIYLAAIGPKNIQLATEIADGFIPAFFSPLHWPQAFGDLVADVRQFDIAPLVRVELGDDIAACRDALRPEIALYVGGMGGRRNNYYNHLACRYGFERAAAEIQERYLSGDRRAAIAAVPDELIDSVALVGPRGRVADQLNAWTESVATTFIVEDPTDDVMELLASELV